MAIKLRVGTARAYSQKDFQEHYRKIKSLTKKLNRAIPHVHQRSRFDDEPLAFERGQEMRLKNAVRQSWHDIVELYTNLRELIQMLDVVRYYPWQFITKDMAGQEVVMQMSGKCELQTNQLLEDLHDAVIRTFGTCGYLLELFCIKANWSIDQAVTLRGYVYPSYTEGDHPIRLRSTRRFIVADIAEDCKEQLALVDKIFRLAKS